MVKNKFSLLVVEPCREAREFLWELFHTLGYQVILAENAEMVRGALAEVRDSSWPDIAVVAQGSPENGCPDLLTHLQEQTGLLDHVSVIVLPTFEAEIPGDPRGGVACRLKTLTNLLSVVNGLARKKLTVRNLCPNPAKPA